MPVLFYLYSLDFPNGKKYIGLTKDPSVRLIRHRDLAKFGFNLPVYVAIRKYGLPPQRVLCIGNFDYISHLEIKAIFAFGTTSRRFGYNVALGGALNPTASSEVREKLRAAGLGRHPSIKTREKQSAAHKDKHPSSLTRLKMSTTRKGRRQNPEWVAKRMAAIRAKPFKARGYSGMKGKRHSPETLAKMSRAQRDRYTQK